MVTELWSGLGRLVAEVTSVFRNWGCLITVKHDEAILRWLRSDFGPQPNL